MKTIKITLLLFLCTFMVNAQEIYKHSLSGIKKVKIITDTSIELTVGNSNQLVINNANSNKHYNDNDHTDRQKSRKDKSKGLKPLYANGNDNTGQGFEVIKDGNTLIVRDLKSFMKRSGFAIQLPKGMDVSINCGNLGHAKITGITSDIEVITNVGHIELYNISGPVTASTNTGQITAIFSTVNQSSPISLHTNTGDVDVSLSSTTKANLELKTNMGEVYTDFDFKVEKSKGLSAIGNPRKISIIINGGGVKISLRSNMGNVYLRKK